MFLLDLVYLRWIKVGGGRCWHIHTCIELHYKVDINTVYDKVGALCSVLT